jgi:transposase
MVSEGKTQREIAEHFGLSGKEVVRELLKRERRKEAKISAGIMPRPKGRPRKDATPRSIFAEQVYEINRLKMENELLRDFLQLTGRK